MSAEEDPRLERCTVTIDYEGNATAVYRFAGNDVDGRDTLDEDVSDWSESEIAAAVCATIGADGLADCKRALNLIKVVWE